MRAVLEREQQPAAEQRVLDHERVAGAQRALGIELAGARGAEQGRAVVAPLVVVLGVDERLEQRRARDAGLERMEDDGQRRVGRQPPAPDRVELAGRALEQVAQARAARRGEQSRRERGDRRRDQERALVLAEDRAERGLARGALLRPAARSDATSPLSRWHAA